MAWVKIDDQFHDHPKVLEVGPLAECLYVRGLAYAARYLTDGFIPLGHLRRMGDMDAIAEAENLVHSGLWVEVDKGYQIHDYLDCGVWTEPKTKHPVRRMWESMAWRVRPLVIARDGYICGICGHDVAPNDVDIDHIVPISKGGSNNLANLRVSHRFCNRQRGAGT